MKAEIRCLVDTNVCISAVLLPGGVPYRAVRRVLEVGVLCQSPAIMHELRSRIYRQKFDKYIRDADREDFLTFLAENSVTITTGDVRVTVSRDPDDNKVLELALCAEADVIITGDDDLLELNPFRGIPILKPRDFLEWVDN